MKLILVIFLFNTCFAFGQKGNKTACYPQVDTLTKREVYKSVDEMPKVVGGMEELFLQISKKLKYPHIDKHPIESKVIVAFIVDIDGQIIGKRTVKNIEGTRIANDVLDILDDVKWEPGTCNGKVVPVFHLLPIIIELNR